MKIEIPITEVQEFLSNYYNIDVGLKNIGEDKIETNIFGFFNSDYKGSKKRRSHISIRSKWLCGFVSKRRSFLTEKKN